MTAAKGDPRPNDPDRLEGVAHPRETTALLGRAAEEAAFVESWRSGRVPHAWLLAGPRGIGKATFAYAAARLALDAASEAAADALFGAEALGLGSDAAQRGAPTALPRDPDSPTARQIRAGSHPRLFELRRGWNEQTKTHRTVVTVEGVRRLIQFFQLSAADGGWRAALIDAADDMNTEAANALLKTLEEPPPRALIFLIAHAPGRLPPTLRSRCRMLAFRNLGLEEAAAAARAAAPDLGPDDAARLVALAAGSPGEALSLRALDGLALYGDILALFDGAPPLPRDRLDALVEGLSGREGRRRLEAVGRLWRVSMERIARAGVLGPPEHEAAPGERAALARLCPDPVRARLWAEASVDAGERLDAAHGLNLDPQRTILDIALSLERALGRGRFM